MSDTRSDEMFSFSMGEFDATFPLDRSYAKNHMWGSCLGDASNMGSASDTGSATWRFGLTAYAVRLLQDVYFLDWEHDPDATLKAGQMIGSIESKKAESDLYSPLAGKLLSINDVVLSDPALINADPYGSGWMFEMSIANDQLAILLSPQEYQDHLEEAWKVAQRTIKGQANL